MTAMELTALPSDGTPWKTAGAFTSAGGTAQSLGSGCGTARQGATSLSTPLRAKHSAELLVVARRGRWKQVPTLLARGADARTSGERKVSVLMLAARACAVEAVDSLLRSRADPCAKDSSGSDALMHSALCQAAEAGEVVNLLCAANADVTRRDNKHRTALIIAAGAGACSAARAMLARRADVHAVARVTEATQETTGFKKMVVGGLVKDHTLNPLDTFMRQVRRGDEEEERQDDREHEEMMEAVADVDFEQPRDGLDVVPEITLGDTDECINIHVGGLDSSEDGSSSDLPSIDVLAGCEMFISSVAPLRKCEMRRQKPGPEEEARIRAQSAALRNLTPSFGGARTTSLVEAARAGHVEMVELLLAAGARPGATDAVDGTALEVAAQHGHVRTCEAIVRFEAGRVARVTTCKPELIASFHGSALRYDPLMDAMLGREFVVQSVRPDGGVGLRAPQGSVLKPRPPASKVASGAFGGRSPRSPGSPCRPASAPRSGGARRDSLTPPGATPRTSFPGTPRSPATLIAAGLVLQGTPLVSLIAAPEDRESAPPLLYFPASVLSSAQAIAKEFPIQEADGMALKAAHEAALRAAELNGHQRVTALLHGYEVHDVS